LKVEIDPRARATAAELQEQLRLGLEIFGEVHRARRALAEIGAVKKRLSEVKQQLAGKNPEILEQVTAVETAIMHIERGSKAPNATAGLETASNGMSSALRVVEGSDRAIPSQAIDVYRESDDAAKRAIAEWSQIKAAELTKLNNALLHAGIDTIQVSEIERAAEDFMTE